MTQVAESLDNIVEEGEALYIGSINRVNDSYQITAHTLPETTAKELAALDARIASLQIEFNRKYFDWGVATKTTIDDNALCPHTEAYLADYEQQINPLIDERQERLAQATASPAKRYSVEKVNGYQAGHVVLHK